MDQDSSMSASTYSNGFAAFSSVAAQQQQQQQQQQFQSQQPPPPTQQLFGLIAPSAPVRTDFVPVEGSNGTKFTLSVSTATGDFPSPLTSIHELVFFLLPGATLPPQSGLLVYWQVEVTSTTSGVQAQSGFELLGSLVPLEKQSDIFRTGWSEREEFIDLDRQQPPPVVTVNFGISVEPLDVIRNLTNSNSNSSNSSNNNNNNNNRFGPEASNNNDRRPLVAQKIAKDLYNFMLSFDTGGARGSQSMTVPANIFERWWKRFEAKLKRDPNFFLKNDED